MELEGIKGSLNKFNITNTPTLYDESFMKKQSIQENYFTEAAAIILFLLFLSFILLHIDSCAKGSTKFIIRSDFTLFTGGESQTFGGGYITYLYIIAMIFLAITLLQE
jgi:hypothetical protein